MEDPRQLTEIAVVCLGALACGLLLLRLKQAALVGYIAAGRVLDPSGFGLIDARENIRVLAELGVTPLLFLIGMELSLGAFRGAYRITFRKVQRTHAQHQCRCEHDGDMIRHQTVERLHRDFRSATFHTVD